MLKYYGKLQTEGEILKKKAIILSAILVGMNTSAYAADISDWAVADYENLSRSGILSYDIVSNNLKAPITRLEVCRMLTKLYDQLTITGTPDTNCPFTDTDDEDVIKAYAAGIVSGKSDTVFDPEGSVTRQEFAKMLLNTLSASGISFNTDDDLIGETLSEYEDSGRISDWALSAMTVCIKTGIMNGTSDNALSPGGTASREQAICMISRVYNQFVEDRQNYEVASITSRENGQFGDMTFTWSQIPDVKKYMLLIKDSSAQLMDSFETSVASATINCEDYLSGLYTIILGFENNNGIQTYSTPSDIDFSAPVYESIPVQALTYSQKEARVFPSGQPFQNAEEASAYMTTVTVPVWKVGADGQKYESKASLTVNSGLAEEVVNIFTEIFNSPEQFPIKSVGGYYWRNTASGNLSQHSYGTCIDINPDENYYVTPDGTPIVGSFWKPYENQYSIPEDGSVVAIFNKYGWGWGGNRWSDKYSKDYMHFTYLGK